MIKEVNFYGGESLLFYCKCLITKPIYFIIYLN